MTFRLFEDLEVVFHHSVGRVLNIIHDDIKVNFVRLLTISVKALAHLDAIWMVQHLKNLKFTIFVSLILEDLLNSNSLTSLSNCGLEYDTKGTIADDFLRIISEALLLSEET